MTRVVTGRHRDVRVDIRVTWAKDPIADHTVGIDGRNGSRASSPHPADRSLYPLSDTSSSFRGRLTIDDIAIDISHGIPRQSALVDSFAPEIRHRGRDKTYGNIDRRHFSDNAFFVNPSVVGIDTIIIPVLIDRVGKACTA